MPYLQLSHNANFRPLMKLTPKQMKLVENSWHHALLSINNLVPTEENTYSDISFTSSDILYIVRVYGIRPYWCQDHFAQWSDDELYEMACR